MFSAPRIRDDRPSSQKEKASFKSRRSVSVDTRARGSYVPDKRASSEERKSGNRLNRWGDNNRKSSINLPDSKRKDTRPLTDKAYQKRKVSELIEFLDETGFSPSLTVSRLMTPSKKDFENVFQFLYRFLDPMYEVKRIEDEGPRILKNLGYPFTVNKSAFFYVARTNFPSLLGVLIWLMDLNKFARKVEMKNLLETAGSDENAEIHKILFRYICQCHYNPSHETEENKDDNVFAEIIKTYIVKDLNELIAKNEEKKILLASVEEEINTLKSLADRDAVLDKNMVQYENYISKMKSHYKSKNELCEKLMVELKQKESELKVLQEAVSQKQDAYDAQGFDGIKHQNYFEIQKKELVEKLDKKRALTKDLRDKSWEAEIDKTKISEKVTAAVEASKELHNSIVSLLKDVSDSLLTIKNPQVQKLYGISKLNFSVFNINLDDSNVQSNTSLRGVWKDTVERITSTDEILKKISASLSEKINELEIQISEASTKLKVITVEKNKLEHELDSKTKEADNEVADLEAKYEKRCELIKALQEEKSRLEKVFREMAEEKKMLQELQEKKEKELADYLIEQQGIFECFLKNIEIIEQASQACGNKIAQTFEELKDL